MRSVSVPFVVACISLENFVQTARRKEQIINEVWFDEGEEYLYFSSKFGRSEHEVLPPEVMEWAGIETEMGKFEYSYSVEVDPFMQEGSVFGSLAELNDRGMTFKDIVLVIDRYF